MYGTGADATGWGETREAGFRYRSPRRPDQKRVPASSAIASTPMLGTTPPKAQPRLLPEASKPVTETGDGTAWLSFTSTKAPMSAAASARKALEPSTVLRIWSRFPEAPETSNMLFTVVVAPASKITCLPVVVVSSRSLNVLLSEIGLLVSARFRRKPDVQCL